MISKEVLQTLEFDRVREQLKSYAQSSLGKERAEALVPFTEREEVERAQAETEDAVALLLQWNDPPLFGIVPLRGWVHHASLGGVLSAGQLLAIGESLRVAQALHQYAKEAEDSPLVSQIRALFTHSGLQQEIAAAIVSEDTIADSASPTLFRLRRSMKAKQDQVKSKLNQIMLSAAQGGHLRESLVTLREGRYVLPVKAESRRAVQGIVHDQSGSGATLFIEPMAVVELNNEIRRLESEEQEEIHRILAALSQEVAEYKEELGRNELMLQHLDFSFAKGKLALAMHAVRPIFTADREISLLGARHPLLGEGVVPIDFQLGDSFTTLVITGPNTGGKTVTLKTVGLLTVMGQAGLQIPAKASSRLGLFQDIYADIGDQQSIAMSLSTFSASMRNIVTILRSADEQALVLFDELGAGTDPTEGAALAMAILQHLTERDIRTVATTHYSELKLYAMREARVQNASVAFDVQTLSPTYRLEIGLPGRSNAFEISKRLGLPEEILREARQRVDEESVQFEDVLKQIEADRKAAARALAEVETRRHAEEVRQAQREKEWEAREQEAHRRREQAKEEARALVEEAQTLAQSLLKEAKKAKQADTATLDRTANALRERVQEKEARWRAETRVRARTPKGAAPTWTVGQTVEVLSLGQTASLLTLPDKNGEVRLQMGILKMTSSVKDLAPVSTEAESSVTRPERFRSQTNRALSFSPQIDLRGERLDAALERVDKYIDDAVLYGMKEVRLLHGKGTGALRQGIAEFLSKDRRVKKYQLAEIKEGGAGVTVVELA